MVFVAAAVVFVLFQVQCFSFSAMVELNYFFFCCIINVILVYIGYHLDFIRLGYFFCFSTCACVCVYHIVICITMLAKCFFSPIKSIVITLKYQLVVGLIAATRIIYLTCCHLYDYTRLVYQFKWLLAISGGDRESDEVKIEKISHVYFSECIVNMRNCC